jgi:hypothetical protein
VLRALTRLFGRRSRDPAQLSFELSSAPRTSAEMLRRLEGLGLRGVTDCRLTRNRTVMVSFAGGELRVHEGFLDAPEEVHRAIVTFVSGRRRSERLAARRLILEHEIPRIARAPRRSAAPHPDDAGMVAKLHEWHRRYNEEHFGGTLKPVRIHVSRRMKSRLGHYLVAEEKGGPGEIHISRRHIRRHGWEEALHTLLHEMVHQWQDETGVPIDHRAGFRAKCRAVGITPSARRRPELSLPA